MKSDFTRVAGNCCEIAENSFHFSRPHNQIQSACGVSIVSLIRTGFWYSGGGQSATAVFSEIIHHLFNVNVLMRILPCSPTSLVFPLSP